MVFRARSNEWVPFMSCMSSTVYIKKIIWVMNLIIQGNTLRNRNKHALVKNDFILRCRNVSKFFFSLIRGQKWSKAIQECAEHQSACMWWLYIATKQGEVRATISFAFAEQRRDTSRKSTCGRTQNCTTANSTQRIGRVLINSVKHLPHCLTMLYCNSAHTHGYFESRGSQKKWDPPSRTKILRLK